MKLEPIRLRFVPRLPPPVQSNPRDAFWNGIAPIDQDTGLSESEVSESEGKLRREFGPELRQLLIQELAEPLRQIEHTAYPVDFDRFLFSLLERPRSEKGWDQAQAFDAFTRLLEQRQQLFRDSPSLRRVQERLAAASSVTFSVRLAGYSSLNLDLSLGSIKSVADAFDNYFESFRVFLEAFVPQAFGQVFDETSADRLDFSIQIPAAYEQAFSDSAVQSTSTATSAPATGAAAPPTSTPRERAEWLWRLANGSLLVPFLLALLVMYFGIATLKDLKGSQTELLRPILEHQIKLLEEDRRRMFREPTNPVPPASASATTTPTSERK